MKCKCCGTELPNKPTKTIKIPELKIEVETEIHDKDKCLKDIKILKGWRLLKVFEIIELFNNKEYNKKLNLSDTWEFIEQPFNFNKEKDYVARFYADSDRASLYCHGGPLVSDPSLGVRFCKEIK